SQGQQWVLYPSYFKQDAGSILAIQAPPSSSTTLEQVWMDGSTYVSVTCWSTNNLPQALGKISVDKSASGTTKSPTGTTSGPDQFQDIVIIGENISGVDSDVLVYGTPYLAALSSNDSAVNQEYWLLPSNYVPVGEK